MDFVAHPEDSIFHTDSTALTSYKGSIAPTDYKGSVALIIGLELHNKNYLPRYFLSSKEHYLNLSVSYFRRQTKVSISKSAHIYYGRKTWGDLRDAREYFKNPQF